MIARLSALIVALALLAGCSSTTGTSSSSTSTATSGQAVDVAAAAKPKTAEEISTALAAKIPTMKVNKVFTAADDPNKQLGRPNGYTGKTAFADSRIPDADLEFLGEFDTERGGSVEVFADEATATARMTFIQDAGKKLGALAEYDYVVGGVLVRVAKGLTPDQAAEYESALKAIA